MIRISALPKISSKSPIVPLQYVSPSQYCSRLTEKRSCLAKPLSANGWTYLVSIWECLHNLWEGDLAYDQAVLGIFSINFRIACGRVVGFIQRRPINEVIQPPILWWRRLMECNNRRRNEEQDSHNKPVELRLGQTWEWILDEIVPLHKPMG